MFMAMPSRPLSAVQPQLDIPEAENVSNPDSQLDYCGLSVDLFKNCVYLTQLLRYATSFSLPIGRTLNTVRIVSLESARSCLVRKAMARTAGASY
jgi:hypothetical protein